MLSSAHASRLSPQRRASAIRAYIVRYLTDLNQHMIKGQSYDEQSTRTHSDDRLAELVQFGLSRPASPFVNLTPLQARLITLDATGRYSPSMNKSSTWSDNDVASRLTRRVTSAQIRQRVGLSKGMYEREMMAARRQVMSNMGVV